MQLASTTRVRVARGWQMSVALFAVDLMEDMECIPWLGTPCAGGVGNSQYPFGIFSDFFLGTAQHSPPHLQSQEHHYRTQFTSRLYSRKLPKSPRYLLTAGFRRHQSPRLPPLRPTTSHEFRTAVLEDAYDGQSGALNQIGVLRLSAKGIYVRYHHPIRRRLTIRTIAPARMRSDAREEQNSPSLQGS